MTNSTTHCTDCGHYKVDCEGSNAWNCPTGRYEKKMTEHEKHIRSIAEASDKKGLCAYDVVTCGHIHVNCTECIYEWMMSFKEDAK